MALPTLPLKEILFSNLLNKITSNVLFQINNNYQSFKRAIQNNLHEKSTEHLK